MTISFLKIFIDGLNNKNTEDDVKLTHEKGMQDLWKGKFEMETSGTSIPLIYKIVER